MGTITNKTHTATNSCLPLAALVIPQRVRRSRDSLKPRLTASGLTFASRPTSVEIRLSSFAGWWPSVAKKFPATQNPADANPVALEMKISIHPRQAACCRGRLTPLTPARTLADIGQPAPLTIECCPAHVFILLVVHASWLASPRIGIHARGTEPARFGIQSDW